MALTPLRTLVSFYRRAQNVFSSSLVIRPFAYKSAISLETLYPNSSLKLTTPAFKADSNEKFSGYIPMNRLEVTYSASSGPGGQNVNKVHTKVDLRFKVNEADWLHPDIRERLIAMHASRLSKEGYLIIKSDVTRSQQLNLADCLQRLRGMIRAAAEPRPQPSPATQERHRQRQLNASRLRVALKREASVKRAAREPFSAREL